jgi:hypothetical protein
MTQEYGYKPKAPLLEDLRKTWPDKSDEEIIEEMRKNGYVPFRIPFGPNYRKIAFRRKRT